MKSSSEFLVRTQKVPSKYKNSLLQVNDSTNTEIWSIWDQLTTKYTKSIEMIQGRAATFITNAVADLGELEGAIALLLATSRNIEESL